MLLLSTEPLLPPVIPPYFPLHSAPVKRARFYSTTYILQNLFCTAETVVSDCLMHSARVSSAECQRLFCRLQECAVQWQSLHCRVTASPVRSRKVSIAEWQLAVERKRWNTKPDTRTLVYEIKAGMSSLISLACCKAVMVSPSRATSFRLFRIGRSACAGLELGGRAAAGKFKLQM